MRVSDSSTVMGTNGRNLILTDFLANDLAEFEFSFLGINLMGLETALDIKEDSVVLVGLLNGDDIHVSERESRISSVLTIDLNKTFLRFDNLSGFLSVEGIAESLLEEYVKGDALSKLVRTRGRSGGVNTSELAKIPGLGSSESLK